MKKIIVVVSLILFLLTTIFMFRVNILEILGNFLIKVDSIEQVNYVFVLGGNPKDRGDKAAQLINEGYGNKIVCLGGNESEPLKVMDVYMTGAELTQYYLLKNTNVDTTKVILLKEGTSTLEECEEIIKYCKERNESKIIIVTDLFHTNRVSTFFKERFTEEGISLILQGSKSSIYDEAAWWNSEEGLLMVNNEYVKTLYYFIKY